VIKRQFFNVFIILAAIASAASLSGCVTNQDLDQALSGWVGRDADDLVRSWGAPNSTYSLKDGGKIITYERLTVQTTGSGDFRDTESSHCKIDLTVNPDGKVTGGKWSGNNEQCGAMMTPAATPASSLAPQPPQGLSPSP